MIDSGQVPRGNGEKQPGEGDEIVSETVCLQRAGVLIAELWFQIFGFRVPQSDDRVPIEEWACEYAVCRCLNPSGVEA